MSVLKKTHVHGLCVQYLYNKPRHFLGYVFPFLNNASKNVKVSHWWPHVTPFDQRTGGEISTNNQSLKKDYHKERPTGL